MPSILDFVKNMRFMRLASAPEPDIFSPRTEPARFIYAAFCAESVHRKERELDEWLLSERQAVFQDAAEFASVQGWPAPTMEMVERAENAAVGSADYGSKWAIKLANSMSR